ncbi:MAG: hypothetical protein DSO01_07390 [Archaeoglobi archaeon]|nr:MAG: hypothetical protein DSN99_08145 [Archaeoglobi archaeon]TDA25539.1 MAG: hypothetical protein DSO01_07390 [Archaeoglobi archaeon]
MSRILSGIFFGILLTSERNFLIFFHIQMPVSNKKISDEAIVDAAKLLRKGAKMLSYYCPECHFPLFESEGRIFCPNCEKEVIIEKETEKEEKKEEVKEETRSNLLNAMENAVVRICELIISSNSPEEIKTLSESIEKIVNAIERMRKVQ